MAAAAIAFRTSPTVHLLSSSSTRRRKPTTATPTSSPVIIPSIAPSSSAIVVVSERGGLRGRRKRKTDATTTTTATATMMRGSSSRSFNNSTATTTITSSPNKNNKNNKNNNNNNNPHHRCCRNTMHHCYHDHHGTTETTISISERRRRRRTSTSTSTSLVVCKVSPSSASSDVVEYLTTHTYVVEATFGQIAAYALSIAALGAAFVLGVSKSFDRQNEKDKKNDPYRLTTPTVNKFYEEDEVASMIMMDDDENNGGGGGGARDDDDLRSSSKTGSTIWKIIDTKLSSSSLQNDDEEEESNIKMMKKKTKKTQQQKQNEKKKMNTTTTATLRKKTKKMPPSMVSEASSLGAVLALGGIEPSARGRLLLASANALRAAMADLLQQQSQGLLEMSPSTTQKILNTAATGAASAWLGNPSNKSDDTTASFSSSSSSSPEIIVDTSDRQLLPLYSKAFASLLVSEEEKEDEIDSKAMMLSSIDALKATEDCIITIADAVAGAYLAAMARAPLSSPSLSKETQGGGNSKSSSNSSSSSSYGALVNTASSESRLPECRIPELSVTRGNERFRNEAALRRWLRYTFVSVQEIYEDKYYLWGLLPDGVSLSNGALGRTTIIDNRRQQLDSLGGNRLLVSLLVEFSDVAYPLLRAFVQRASQVLSFVLVTIIGQSIGLIARGVRLSLRPDTKRDNL